MDLLRMITDLQAERQRLDEAIGALERLSANNSPRRGRPPRWLKEEIRRHVEGNREDHDEDDSKPSLVKMARVESA